ncbi:MAG TPA: glycosyl hydrolase family 8 [Polyangia bacterium]|nr:glycosyl hydrolase family 8 [Polyangia bacterium]
MVSICLPACLLLACGSSGGGAGGTGGSGSGTGGSTGTGGSGATGTAGLGTGKGFAFPQNKATGACVLTTVSGASSMTQTAYNNWKTSYLVTSGSGLRVQRPENGNDTVSEGIGYGMLAAVYMGDKATFDGLWTYTKTHLDGNGLMTWCIPSGGSGSCSGSGSATDADEDIAFALLMASDQWQGGTYLTDGVAMVNAIHGSDLFSDYSVQNGDAWNSTNAIYPDYFSPAYYRVFAKAANDPSWSNVVDVGYQHLAALTGTGGLVPNSTNLQNSLDSSCQISGRACDLKYGYDACRMPWRIGMDACWNDEKRAITYLTAIGGYFNSNGGVASIGDGYTSPNGPKTSSNQNSAFIGPAGIAGMAAGFGTLRDNAFMFNGGGNSTYFAQSLRVISMLMMSGNMLDFSQL